jgi:hypothetical protein
MPAESVRSVQRTALCVSLRIYAPDVSSLLRSTCKYSTVRLRSACLVVLLTRDARLVEISVLLTHCSSVCNASIVRTLEEHVFATAVLSLILFVLLVAPWVRSVHDA